MTETEPARKICLTYYSQSSNQDKLAFFFSYISFIVLYNGGWFWGRKIKDKFSDWTGYVI